MPDPGFLVRSWVKFLAGDRSVWYTFNSLIARGSIVSKSIMACSFLPSCAIAPAVTTSVSRSRAEIRTKILTACVALPHETSLPAEFSFRYREILTRHHVMSQNSRALHFSPTRLSQTFFFLFFNQTEKFGHLFIVLKYIPSRHPSLRTEESDVSFTPNCHCAH